MSDGMAIENIPPGDRSAHSRPSPGQKQSIERSAGLELGNDKVEDAMVEHLEEQTGYVSELARNRSTFQLAFMAFILASIPYGLATSLIYPLLNGGPATMIWGWMFVSLVILCVALSLAEITSVYPTAGGVYYQAFMLSSPHWRRIASWICGWAYVVGNVLITLAVNFGTTLFIVGCVNVFETADGEGMFPAETYQVYLIFVALTLLCNAVSSLGNKWLPMLDTFAIYWTGIGVITISVCLLVLAKNGRHSASYALGHFEPLSGWPDGWAFCVGLLNAAYATSSTGMLIAMCEEVPNPKQQVPKALVGTVIMNTTAGLITLITFSFVLPDLETLVKSEQPVPVIVKSAVGNDGGAFALLIPLIVLAVMCGIGCTTAASRVVWAFSRDGGIPGSAWWRKVNSALQIPFNAMMLSMMVQLVLGALYFGSATAFNSFSSGGIICLAISYATPIAVSLFRGRKDVSHGGFYLGRWGTFCNIIALCWSVLVVPLFCMPTTIPVTANSVNYASVVFVGFILLATFWYFAWGKTNYRGPPAVNDHLNED